MAQEDVLTKKTFVQFPRDNIQKGRIDNTATRENAKWNTMYKFVQFTSHTDIVGWVDTNKLTHWQRVHRRKKKKMQEKLLIVIKSLPVYCRRIITFFVFAVCCVLNCLCVCVCVCAWNGKMLFEMLCECEYWVSAILHGKKKLVILFCTKCFILCMHFVCKVFIARLPSCKFFENKMMEISHYISGVNATKANANKYFDFWKNKTMHVKTKAKFLLWNINSSLFAS